MENIFHFLSLSLFAAFALQKNGVFSSQFDCFVFLPPIGLNPKSISECPKGLQWFPSVQFCCISVDQNFRPSPATDGLFYQQRYFSVPKFAANDSVPEGCIRAVHFPNESLAYCGPRPLSPLVQRQMAKISDQLTHFLTIPVKDSLAQNIYCCSSDGKLSAKDQIKWQSVYHGTIAANYTLIAESGTKQISLHAACRMQKNKKRKAFDKEVDETNGPENGFNCDDATNSKCAKESAIFDYNRNCCAPKCDTNLTTDGEFHAEIKIRTSNDRNGEIEHVNVSVGDYEYDYTSLGPRRRLFNHFKDTNEPNEDSAVKAQSFEKPFFVSTKKADELFWEMSQRNFFARSPKYENYGWFYGYEKYGRNCVDFVYEFVCNLFNGNCPPEKFWPKNFVEIDKKLNGSHAFENKTSELYGQFNECSLKVHELRIEYALAEHGKYGTPVVTYETGVVNTSEEIMSINDVMLIQEIRNEQKCHVESIESDGTVLCKAVLHVCSNKYVLCLAIKDYTASFLVQMHLKCQK
ncbi:hypothetical protein niasHS_006203 [Heterodera schachtii]|uniref:Uncharacterized protein n=1 Tax=Heterodera schachtii TaxID=97005 RepID=A0ABD2JT20_HETSC